MLLLVSDAATRVLKRQTATRVLVRQTATRELVRESATGVFERHSAPGVFVRHSAPGVFVCQSAAGVLVGRVVAALPVREMRTAFVVVVITANEVTHVVASALLYPQRLASGVGTDIHTDQLLKVNFELAHHSVGTVPGELAVRAAVRGRQARVVGMSDRWRGGTRAVETTVGRNAIGEEDQGLRQDRLNRAVGVAEHAEHSVFPVRASGTAEAGNEGLQGGDVGVDEHVVVLGPGGARAKRGRIRREGDDLQFDRGTGKGVDERCNSCAHVRHVRADTARGVDYDAEVATATRTSCREGRGTGEVGGAKRGFAVGAAGAEGDRVSTAAATSNIAATIDRHRHAPAVLDVVGGVFSRSTRAVTRRSWVGCQRDKHDPHWRSNARVVLDARRRT